MKKRGQQKGRKRKPKDQTVREKNDIKKNKREEGKFRNQGRFIILNYEGLEESPF